LCIEIEISLEVCGVFEYWNVDAPTM